MVRFTGELGAKRSGPWSIIGMLLMARIGTTVTRMVPISEWSPRVTQSEVPSGSVDIERRSITETEINTHWY